MDCYGLIPMKFFEMKSTGKNIFKYFGIGALTFSMASCTNNDPSDSPYVDKIEPVKSTILVYAIATNTLSRNLVSDKNEMLEAVDMIDLSKHNVLIFQTTYGGYDDEGNLYGKVELVKLEKGAENPAWTTVNEYPEGTDPLNPATVSSVIDYVTEYYPAENYGMIFWSHSTASQPYFPATTVAYNPETGSSSVELPSLGWFGQDLTANDDRYSYMNIDDLADAVPDNLFNFIWFDSCLMSNIESIYQFRNKCKTYVAYPTEVLDDGAPYHLILPYIAKEEPDLVGAAKQFFEYYSRSFGTVTVVDMTRIEELAQFCRSVNAENLEVNYNNMTKYSRPGKELFYDLGDYTLELSKSAGNEISLTEWDELIDRVVLYKATTYGGLLSLYLNTEHFSGISSHVYTYEEDTTKELFYKSLDWYQKTFK